MQSRQLATTRCTSSRSVRDCLASAPAREAYPEIERWLQYGTEWLWNGVDPVLTERGVRSVAAWLEASGEAEDAARVRALADTMAAAPAHARPARGHLPYSDSDDERLFAANAAGNTTSGDTHHA